MSKQIGTLINSKTATGTTECVSFSMDLQKPSGQLLTCEEYIAKLKVEISMQDVEAKVLNSLPYFETLFKMIQANDEEDFILGVNQLSITHPDFGYKVVITVI
jgi:hypothetical protein